MIKKDKEKLNKTTQKIKCAVTLACYLGFLIWVESWWGLLVVPFIYDAYITKKINWQ